MTVRWIYAPGRGGEEGGGRPRQRTVYQTISYTVVSSACSPTIICLQLFTSYLCMSLSLTHEILVYMEHEIF